MHRSLRVLTGIVVCALLVACGGEESPSDATPTVQSSPAVVATPTPTEVPVPDMVIGQIIWAEETDETTGAPLAEVDQFTTESPAIIALVEVKNIPEGSQFTATWTLNDTTLTDSPMVVVAESDMSHAWISFRFTRDGDRRYPIGHIGVTIIASDGTLREASIEIAFP